MECPPESATVNQSTPHQETPLVTIVTPQPNQQLDRLPLYVVVELHAAARPDTLHAWLNGSEVSARVLCDRPYHVRRRSDD